MRPGEKCNESANGKHSFAHGRPRPRFGTCEMCGAPITIEGDGTIVKASALSPSAAREARAGEPS